MNKPALSLLKQTKHIQSDNQENVSFKIDQSDMNKPLFNLNLETIQNINSKENPNIRSKEIELEQE